ncbi:MAG: ABC transporter ATP-binding protein [Candidatus Viridilinea halotolerans]|uniref:ABC transporter ATP-binding protein n=1 Tax=Candidatus Viridilinea halotolerans TaxID=2491704 RepID=A0A426U5N9_9CHLR|nr:MAG: ABC transporter ATP-binding protein [Candidatus Viridilinea halotolerans]
MIAIHDLHKRYGDLVVLCGLSLRVADGEIYGLLGPNGAGKSTLLHLMLGFLRPDQGTIHLLGSDNLEQMRQRIGYIPERQRYHTHYSAREYLRFLGQFSGMGGAELHDRVDHELITVGLGDVADRKLGTFSKGMLQRFGVAQALLGDPDLLLIDEPTSGLDPSGRRAFVELLKQVRRRGHTILLCTHHFHEVELLCDRVGMLVGGRITFEGDVQKLRSVAKSLQIQTAELNTTLQTQLTTLEPSITCDNQTIFIKENSAALQALVLRTLLDADVPILQLEPLERPLEHLYRQAVREERRGEAEAERRGGEEAETRRRGDTETRRGENAGWRSETAGRRGDEEAERRSNEDAERWSEDARRREGEDRVASTRNAAPIESTPLVEHPAPSIIPPAPWAKPKAPETVARGEGDTLLNQLLGQGEGKSQGTEEQENRGTTEQGNNRTGEQGN